jgi:hypothetical protein
VAKQLAEQATDKKLIDSICQQLLSVFPQDHIDEWREANKYIRYQEDPVAFGEKELKEVYTEDIKRMMLSVRDNRCTVAISATGTGKSFSAGSLALWWYKCFPNSKVFTLAAPPEDNLRNILWGEIAKKRSRCPDLFINDKLKDLSISKNNWHFIEGLTIPQSGTEAQREAKFSGKHAPHMLFIVDEGDAVPNEVFRGIDGCMSGTHERLLVLFNPRAKFGKVYEYIINGHANVVELQALNHPNVVKGKDVITGAVSRVVTVQRINEQTRALSPLEEPDAKCFLLPKFLVGATAPKPNRQNEYYEPLAEGYRRVKEECPEFWYKVLAKYPPQGANQLISSEWIDAARARWDLYVTMHGDKPPENVRPILGLDVADMGDDLNTLCKRYGGFVDRIESWSGVDPGETADRAADKAIHYKSACVNVDSIGVGASVAPTIRRKGVKSSRVIVSEKPTELPADKEKARFGNIRDQIWWELRLFLKDDPTAMLPPDDRLRQELELVTYEEDKGKIRIMSKEEMRKLLGRSPDRAESLILTFAPRERTPQVRKLQ